MKILLHPSLAALPEWQAIMARRGYEITVAHHGYDLAIGPDCWHFTPQHREFVELALKQARVSAKQRGPAQSTMFPATES
jgi:hypothetical protein